MLAPKLCPPSRCVPEGPGRGGVGRAGPRLKIATHGRHCKNPPHPERAGPPDPRGENPATGRRSLRSRYDLSRQRQRDARPGGRVRPRIPRSHAQTQRVRQHRFHQCGNRSAASRSLNPEQDPMPPRLKRMSGYDRHPLTSGRQLCSTPPGACNGPETLRRAELEWLPATAPSTVAQCLMRAGAWSLESAPFRIDAADWWYRTTFPRPAANAGVWILGLDGLASSAQVWLNGSPLLRSDNMFLAHECPLDGLLAD